MSKQRTANSIEAGASRGQASTIPHAIRKLSSPVRSRLLKVSMGRHVLPDLYVKHGVEPEDRMVPAGTRGDHKTVDAGVGALRAKSCENPADDTDLPARTGSRAALRVVEIEMLLAALTQPGDGWRTMVEGLVERWGSRALIRDQVLIPAARQLGELWCEDEASFVDVTIGLVRVTQALDMLPEPARDGPGPHIVLAPFPGEQHRFGVDVLAELLRESGWRCTVRLDETQADLARAIGRIAPDIVGISFSAPRMARFAEGLTQRLSASGSRPFLVAGGAGAEASEQLLRASGFDAVMQGAADPVSWLTNFMGERTDAMHAAAS